MAKWSGHIGHIGILDLSWAKTEEDLSGIEKIEHVGVVRVPEHLYQYVISIPCHHVGSIEVTGRGPTQELTGKNRVSGDFLAAGDPGATLSVTGELLITPPLQEIGFRAIRLTGMMLAPRESEALISGKLERITGQIIYYPTDKGPPRLFRNKERIGREFLEWLPEPSVWVILGEVTVEDNVDADLVRAKVPEIVVYGKLIGPEELVPILQVLAVDKFGAIIGRKASALTEEASPWSEER